MNSQQKTNKASARPETIAEFIARGGRVQQLPGIQKSNVYQQRRPVMSYGARSNG